MAADPRVRAVRAVQAFVPREQMERVMGDHRPAAVARASGSEWSRRRVPTRRRRWPSRCSRRAPTSSTAMVFMFASTNLVVELGIVLVVLIGWQFAAAEFIGGAIMIVLLALTGSLVIGHRRRAGRRRLAPCGLGADEHQAMAGVSDERQAELEPSRGTSSCARGRPGRMPPATPMADLTMLRRELVIGYVVAGFLTVAGPDARLECRVHPRTRVWTSLENVVVGPFIAIISFVCSIGNVPLAAALWHGGISFGGVVALHLRRPDHASRCCSSTASTTASPADAAAARPVLGGHGRGRPHRGRPVLGRRTDPPSPSRADRGHRVSLELHDVPQHRLLGGCRRTCTGCTATATGSVAAPAMRSTRCAACRSRSPTPRRIEPMTATTTGSARTAAPSVSTPPRTGTRRRHPSLSLQTRYPIE